METRLPIVPELSLHMGQCCCKLIRLLNRGIAYLDSMARRWRLHPSFSAWHLRTALQGNKTTLQKFCSRDECTSLLCRRHRCRSDRLLNEGLHDYHPARDLQKARHCDG